MSVNFIPLTLLKEGVVVVNWSAAGSWKDLELLKSGIAHTLPETSLEPSKGMETSLVLYSMFKTCQIKLTGNANDAKKSKFANSQIHLKNGNVILTFDSQNTFSSVRKIITVVGKNLNPGKTKAMYKKYIQHLGHKYNEAAWSLAVNNINKAVKKASWGVLGKIKLDAKKIKTLNAVIKKQFDPDGTSASGSAASDEKTRPVGDEKDSNEFTANAISTLLCSQYLGVQNIDSDITHKGFIPIIGNTGLAAFRKKMKNAKRVAAFVDKKLLKINSKKKPDLLKDALRALALSHGYFTVSELKGIQNNRAKLIAAITGTF